MEFRIYGDNIIECIRVIKLIESNTIAKVSFNFSFNNASSIIAVGTIGEKEVNMILVPGFDKSKKQRWEGNVLKNIK